MIAAFSTSSPQASVAIFDRNGGLLGSREAQAPRAASGACVQMLSDLLETLEIANTELTGCLADLGPGSFTGVRVGVTLAKGIAWVQSTSVAGMDAFDLIDPTAAVVLPNKRAEWFLRRVGEVPEIVHKLPVLDVNGYGFADQNQFPHAAGFAKVWDRLEWIAPEQFVPSYRVEPSISIPKRSLSFPGSSI